MKDKTVAILESRVRDHIASLVRKYGGTPFSAPALAEIQEVDPAHIHELIRDSFSRRASGHAQFSLQQIRYG